MRSWHEIVATKRAGSYDERPCLRCFEGRVYHMQRGAWVACERCSGTGRVMVYLYPKAKSPLTVGRLVIHFWPEPHCQGSGAFVLRGGSGSQEWPLTFLGAYTPSKNLRPISGI